MTQLTPSEKIPNKVVIVVRVPHSKDSTCPAYLDPNIYDSYWISLRELVEVLEDEDTQSLAPESRILLEDTLKLVLKESYKDIEEPVITDYTSWARAFKEAVGLIPPLEEESELVDDYGHSRNLVTFLDLHKDCNKKMQFEITWGW